MLMHHDFKMKSKLKSGELSLYFFVWITANLYSLLKLFEAQCEILNNYPKLLGNLSDLQAGWSYVARPKDASDIEWSSLKYYIKVAWYYLMLQFVVSELIRKYKPSVLKYWYILSSTIFIALQMGIRQLLMILAQPVLFAVIIFSGGKKTSIWVTSILLLLSYNSLKYKHFFWNFLDHKDLHDEEVYLALYTVAWIELRCISYCIDYIEFNEKLHSSASQKNIKDAVTTSKLKHIVNMFSYILYLPLLYNGPVILYEDFEKSFIVKNERLLLRLRRFMFDILLFLIYTFLLDLVFHYIYFFAMQNDIELIRNLPTLALCGGGLYMGLEFHMKYVITYGTTGAFARLDNIEPPPIPRCIARVHVYSQMWRHFDVGLYKFLIKYIYKPSLSVVSGLKKIPKVTFKPIASLSTFIFIFMWHGTIWDIFVWSVLNYIGITLEYVGKTVSQSERYKWFKEKVLKSDEMEVRFIAVLCVPLLILSAISNFYLFAGAKVGNLFFECFLQPSLKNTVIVTLSLYCCCQVSMALEDVPSRTDVKRNSSKRVQ